MHDAFVGHPVSVDRRNPLKTILICILLSHLLIIPCHAVDGFETIYPEKDISHAKDMLPDEILPFVNNYDIKSGEGIGECLNRIKTHLAANLKNAVMSLWTPMIMIFMVIILCSVIEPLFGAQTKSFPLTLFGCVEILYLTLSDSQTFFNDSISALKSLYDFSTVLLPCLAGTSVLAGASVSAGVKYTAAALFMNLLLNFSNTFLIPLISAYLVFIVGYAVFNQKLLSVLANLIRWGCKTALTVSTILFTAYINVAGLISSAGDLFSVRITKTALQTALPVVGNILSGAADSLVAGATIVRNSVGVFGLLSVFVILLFPFSNLAVRYFFFQIIARLAELFPNRRFSDLLEGIAGAYGMLLGVIGSGFIMIFLTLISFMQIVGG